MNYIGHFFNNSGTLKTWSYLIGKNSWKDNQNPFFSK